MEIKIIGIDPAPGKGGVAFDGERFFNFIGGEVIPEIGGGKLRGGEGLTLFVKFWLEWSRREGVPLLICWDAPLGRFWGGEKFPPLTQRRIESFFRRKEGIKGFLPEGLSTAPFSTLSHWTISQLAVGYPQFFKPAQEEFQLIGENWREVWEGWRGGGAVEGAWVVETHPAVAIWIWLLERGVKKGRFRYKKGGKGEEEERRENFRQIVEEFVEQKFKGIFLGEGGKLTAKVPKVRKVSENQLEDFLEAYICYQVAEGWVKRGEGYWIGDRYGGFLLPGNPVIGEGKRLGERWKEFLKKEGGES